MKLWDKGLHTAASVETFTVGRDREYDMYLAWFDVVASMAHSTMLSEVGLLSKEDCQSVLAGLRVILGDIENGSFAIAESSEDVHSQVEELLTERIGEAAKRIHTGRSRNDQVLVDMKLYLREQLCCVREEVEELFWILMQLAEKYSAVIVPGYTHFQVAMPSSFGLWFSAYAESLIDDVEQLTAAYRVVNKNPLGSAAGYGSSFPLNRVRTTELLGFEFMNVSSVYAQMTRGKSEKMCAQALGNIAATLSKMAYDLCLYNSQNFNFVTLPTDYTTGSSLMPHKKNPDVFELIRAHCNRVQGVAGEIILLINNLPSGYHRDVQLLKELIIPAFEELRACLQMSIEAMPLLEVKHDIEANEIYKYMYSVDAVHALVQQGKSFRDAYREVGEGIQSGNFNISEHVLAKKGDNIAHEGSIDNPALDLIRTQMDAAITRVDWQAGRRALHHLSAQARD